MPQNENKLAKVTQTQRTKHQSKKKEEKKTEGKKKKKRKKHFVSGFCTIPNFLFKKGKRANLQVY